MCRVDLKTGPIYYNVNAVLPARLLNYVQNMYDTRVTKLPRVLRHLPVSSAYRTGPISRLGVN